MNTPDRLRLTVAGRDPLVVELGRAEIEEALVSPVEVRDVEPSAGQRWEGVRRFEAIVDGWVLEVTAEPARRATLRERAVRAAARTGPHGRDPIRAQIPGRVVRVWVVPGDAVEQGQRLLAVEAMKMENEVRAPRAGTIETVGVAVGETVELGDELVVIG